MQRKSQLADYKQQAKYMGGSIDRNGMSVRRAHGKDRCSQCYIHGMVQVFT